MKTVGGIQPKSVWVVSTEVPSLRGGTPVRNFNLIKRLSQLGYVVRVFCIEDDHNPDDALAKLRALPGVAVTTVPAHRLSRWQLAMGVMLRRVPPYMLAYRRSGLEGALAAALGGQQPEILQLEQLNAYYAVAGLLPEFRRRGSKVVLDAHNVEHHVLKASLELSGFVRRLVGLYILPHVQAVEDRAALDVDILLACSDQDLRYFEALGCKDSVKIANGVDLDYFAISELPAGPSLVFMGGMKYPPNEEAIRWYLDYVHPLVLAEVPGAQLTIIGSNPPAWLRRRSGQDASIICGGYVDDVRHILKASMVCISPVLHGSGTSLKVLEYMASARPVVATPVGARGLGLATGGQIIIANEAHAFAQSVTSLLRDRSAAGEMGGQARRHVEQHYSWSSIGDSLAHSYDTLLAPVEALGT